MRQVWAVARNLVVEILRIRSLLVLMALVFSGITFGFAYWLHTGSGSADEKVQTFLSYSLSVVANFLALLTIFFSIASITRDIKYKQLFTVTTKPISRGGYLAGKFIGMALLNLVLLLSVGAVIFGLVFTLAHYEPDNDVDPAYSRMRLENLVLVAREPVYPTVVGVNPEEIERQVQLEVEKVLASEIEGYYLSSPSEIEERRAREEKKWTDVLTLRSRSVAPGDHIVWYFYGLNPRDRQNGWVFIRYKQECTPNPPDLTTLGEWSYGPQDDVIFTGRKRQKRDTVRTPHEFEIAVEEVSETGDLYVAYKNDESNAPTTVIFPLPNPQREQIGIEALYVAGGFTGNYVRGLLAIYFRLLFLSMLGIALGAWLSYPVAVLTGLVIFVIGLCSNFILISLRYELGAKVFTFAGILMNFLPQLAIYDPVPAIEKGRLVSYQMLTSCLLLLLLLKGGIISLIGYIIFRFRELARVIV